MRTVRSPRGASLTGFLSLSVLTTLFAWNASAKEVIVTDAKPDLRLAAGSKIDRLLFPTSLTRACTVSAETLRLTAAAGSLGSTGESAG